jgi:hypothetical protein
MLSGHCALSILTTIALTPRAQMFARPHVSVCAATTIATVKVTLVGSTALKVRDVNSLLSFRVTFGTTSPCALVPKSTFLIH